MLAFIGLLLIFLGISVQVFGFFVIGVGIIRFTLISAALIFIGSCLIAKWAK